MTTDSEPRDNQGKIPRDTFAHRLMLARAHAGHLSITKAAEICDLDDGSWANWEKGTRPRDRYETAKVIAEKLGVDRQWLLDGGQLPPDDRQAVLRRARRAPHVVTDRVTTGYRSRADRPYDTRPPAHPMTSGIRRSGLLPHRRRP